LRRNTRDAKEIWEKAKHSVESTEKRIKQVIVDLVRGSAVLHNNGLVFIQADGQAAKSSPQNGDGMSWLWML